MKKITFYILVFAVLFSCTTDESTSEPIANIFEGDVILISQAELDDFGAMEYTEITGSLRIISEAINSLQALSTLNTIGGHLGIEGTLLENLNGLNNLTTIGESLTISFNPNLMSLSPLENVVSSISGIHLEANSSIVNLNGLQNLELQEGSFIRFWGNINLVSLASLENTLPENLGTFSTRPLGLMTSNGEPAGTVPTPITDLSFLSSVTSIDSVFLVEFQGNTLQGLHNITSCASQFIMSFSPFIEDLSVLENLVAINNLSLFSNSSLQNLNGLDNVLDATGEFFSIAENPMLSDFCSLENLFVNGTYETIDYYVNSNLYNPTIQDIIDGNCSN